MPILNENYVLEICFIFFYCYDLQELTKVEYPKLKYYFIQVLKKIVYTFSTLIMKDAFERKNALENHSIVVMIS